MRRGLAWQYRQALPIRRAPCLIVERQRTRRAARALLVAAHAIRDDARGALASIRSRRAVLLQGRACSLGRIAEEPLPTLRGARAARQTTRCQGALGRSAILCAGARALARAVASGGRSIRFAISATRCGSAFAPGADLAAGALPVASAVITARVARCLVGTGIMRILAVDHGSTRAFLSTGELVGTGIAAATVGRTTHAIDAVLVRALSVRLALSAVSQQGGPTRARDATRARHAAGFSDTARSAELRSFAGVGAGIAAQASRSATPRSARRTAVRRLRTAVAAASSDPGHAPAPASLAEFAFAATAGEYCPADREPSEPVGSRPS